MYDFVVFKISTILVFKFNGLLHNIYNFPLMGFPYHTKQIQYWV